MYLTNRFKAKIEKIKAESKARGIAEGRAIGRAERIAEARAEGRAEGRAEVKQLWTEWYQRLKSAEARGAPFDEPPPFLNGGKSG